MNELKFKMHLMEQQYQHRNISCQHDPYHRNICTPNVHFPSHQQPPPYPHIQQTMPIQYPTSRMYSTSIPHTGNIQQYSQIPGNTPLIRNVRTPFHPCIPSMTEQHPGIYQGQNHVSANGSIRPPQLYSQQGMSQGRILPSRIKWIKNVAIKTQLKRRDSNP